MKHEYEALITRLSEFYSLRDLAPGTRSSYLSYLRQFLKWAESNLNGKPVSDVSWAEVRSYLLFLKNDRKLGNRTINCHIAQLHNLWRYGLKREWDRYEVPTLRFNTKLPAVPTKDQMAAIINSTDNIKHKAEIALLYSSGLRVSELVSLHCRDIHSSTGSVFISCSKNRSERFAVLSQNTLKILSDYIRQCYKGATHDDWLFPGQAEGSHITAQSVRSVFQKAVDAAGFSDKGFHLHSCRHAFGLHLYESGADILTIKEALGHKSLSSTEVYLTLGIGNGRSVTSPYDL